MDEEMTLTTGQPYMFGVWTIKKGREDEFIAAWIMFARWTYNNTNGAMIGTLLQDDKIPNRFISFNPWEDAEGMTSWRGTTEFKKFLEVVGDLTEDGSSPSTARLVARSYP